MNAFDTLLAQTISSPDLLGDTAANEERKAYDETNPVTLPVLRAALPAVSDRAVELIVAFEVTSETVYNRLYMHPVWPQGQSGCTIGIGYDLGYVTSQRMSDDWHTAQLAPADIAALTGVCGMKGTAAQHALPNVKSVSVPFAAANAVFRNVTLQRTVAQTVAALPRAATLTPDCLGALVSLVYNRGASFAAQGDRYTEMRAIAADVANGNLKDIPTQFRAMKRLWAGQPNLQGLVRRRELEALLFEEGLGQPAG
jgi:GH24 family phage-related lysozyme (muramidase)